MNKTAENVKTLSFKLLQCCCFGGPTDGGSYGYGFPQTYLRTATTQMNLFEPFYDDVMQPIICDKFDVEMFVFFFCLFCCNAVHSHSSPYYSLLDCSLLCQISLHRKKNKLNLFQFSFDTFLGEN